MASPKQHADVLVVGAGPAGLTTALRLASQGVRVAILDKHWRTGAHSYALAIHPSSMGLLSELGVADEVLAHGRRVTRVVFHEDAQVRCEIPLDSLGGRHPWILVAPQSRLEGALESKLRAAGVEVMWNHRLQDLTGGGTHAEVAKLDRVATGYPIAQMEWTVVRTFPIEASWTVGADGYRSMVREKSGIELKRLAEPSTFSVFEFEIGSDPGDAVHVALDANGTSVMWPMAERRCRWSFQVPDARLDLTRERLDDLIRRRAPWFQATAGEIHWASSVTFAPHLVDRFGRDHAWLAGDAAHMASPVGVQSMNRGLAEGAALADALARILRHGEPATRLDDYAAGALREWRTLLNLDSALDASAARDAWVKREASRIVPSLPATGADLSGLLAGLGLSLKTT